MQTQADKVCELNVTGKTVKDVVDEILDVWKGVKNATMPSWIGWACLNGKA